MTAELRIAVFSDVHGNLPALGAVLDDIDRRGAFDEVVAAGDHCLNGPDPATALDLIHERCTSMLYGNTDRDVVDPETTGVSRGDLRRATIEWTRDVLGDVRLERLSGLAFERRVEAPDGASLVIVHANPHDVDRHIRPDATHDDLREIVGETDAAVLTFGHLHIPFNRRFGDTHLVNIAACGLPRDGNRRAVWGEFVWSPGSGWGWTVHRVDYDYGETVLRLLDSGIPDPEQRIRDLLRASYD